ncbi:MAG: hypothetical protein JWM91_449 [Rhodospirillales bacterium]|nr:hypothetical protein [Rhodospirillales bacterium]
MNDSITRPATSPVNAKNGPARVTRDCLDPWNYLEISAGGHIRPCCNFSPLGKLDDLGEQVGAIRDNDKFRALRESLLSGDLQSPCQHCHIRKMVPVRAFKRRLEKAASRRDVADSLAPLQVAEFRIDINEKCNLRCDYCAVSSPDYRGVEMDDGLFTRIEKIVGDIGPRATVHVNGHGETTYHPNWMAMCRAIIDAGHRPQIITNLAKNYTGEEIDLLAKFSSIQVSLDSDDDALMKKIRKSVRATHVFETIQRIRDAAARHNIRPVPRMSFSVGIYDPSIWTLESFVHRIIACGVRDVTFWNLVEMQHQTLVKPLRNLDMADRTRARSILSAVRRKLENADVNYIFAGDFDAMVEQLSGATQLRSTFRRIYRALGRRALSFR